MLGTSPEGTVAAAALSSNNTHDQQLIPTSSNHDRERRSQKHNEIFLMTVACLIFYFKRNKTNLY